MSTKFADFGYKGCNPNLPVHVRDAAISRHIGKNDRAEKLTKQPSRPAGGKGCRKIQRNKLRSLGLLGSMGARVTSSSIIPGRGQR